MSLFQLASRNDSFILHSGEVSRWRINCDELNVHDWSALAYMITQIVPPFSCVVGIPRGGLSLQDALQQYRVSKSNSLLIVDDVFTTGGSMDKFKQAANNDPDFDHIYGAVIFSRGLTPGWIKPLFQLTI